MKRKQTFIKVFSVAIIAAALTTGCSDMTAQQYHEKEYEAQREQCQAKQGTYVGTINSLGSSNTIGTIEVIPTCTSNNVSSPDNTSTEQQVVIGGSVKIIQAGTVSEAPLNGSYAPDTNVLSGTISVPQDNNPQNNLVFNFNATIDGSTMTGTIMAQQYGNEGGSFTASLNGNSSTLAGASSGTAPLDIVHLSGEGTDSDCTLNGHTCAITMDINNTPNSTADAFADSLVPVSSNVTVNITLTLMNPSDGHADFINYSFGDNNGTAQLDLRNGKISGTAPNGNNGSNTLDCRPIGAVAVDGNNPWTCNIGSVHPIQFRVAPTASTK